MKTPIVQLGSFFALAALPVLAAEVTSVVTFDSEASLLWKTVTAAEMPVSLGWPATADKAVVSVDGVVRTNVTDTTASAVNVAFARPASAQAERVVTVKVEYFNGTEPLESKAAKLGFVMGVTADEDVIVRQPETPDWTEAKAMSAVLPIPENATALTIDGSEALGLSAPGWYCLNSIPIAGVALALTADGLTHQAFVTGLPGFLLFLR